MASVASVSIYFCAFNAAFSVLTKARSLAPCAGPFEEHTDFYGKFIYAKTWLVVVYLRALQPLFVHSGGDLMPLGAGFRNASTPKDCCEQCAAESKCHFFSFSSSNEVGNHKGPAHNCWLKSTTGRSQEHLPLIHRSFTTYGVSQIQTRQKSHQWVVRTGGALLLLLPYTVWRTFRQLVCVCSPHLHLQTTHAFQCQRGHGK